MKVNLGYINTSDNITKEMSNNKSFEKEIVDIFKRYYQDFDFGDNISNEDIQANIKAIVFQTDNLYGFYNTSKGRVYIITDFINNCRQTTILFKEEY